MTTLEQFIAESLDQIVNAISTAQSRAVLMGATIAPTIIARRDNPNALTDENWHVPTTVEFDVAVTATDGTSTKGGIGVVAGIVSLGSAGQSNSESETISRIKFSVPVFFPGKSQESNAPRGDVAVA